MELFRFDGWGGSGVDLILGILCVSAGPGSRHVGEIATRLSICQCLLRGILEFLRIMG